VTQRPVTATCAHCNWAITAPRAHTAQRELTQHHNEHHRKGGGSAEARSPTSIA